MKRRQSARAFPPKGRPPMVKLNITWVKSAIGYGEDQKRTIKALGFHRLNQTVVQEDSLAIRGMINKVRHLVKVEAKTDEAE